MVRTLNVVFADSEFRKIEKAKKRLHCKSWREYMMLPTIDTREQS